MNDGRRRFPDINLSQFSLDSKFSSAWGSRRVQPYNLPRRCRTLRRQSCSLRQTLVW
jgi:hypothetical protein